MRRTISILAVGVTAVVVTAVGGAPDTDRGPVPVAEGRAVLRIDPDGPTSTGALSNYFAARLDRRVPRVRRSDQDGKDPHRGRRQVLLRQAPGSAERQADVRTDGGEGAFPRGSGRQPGRFRPTTRSGSSQFKVLLKTKADQYGSFVQIPVATSQLTITKA